MKSAPKKAKWHNITQNTRVLCLHCGCHFVPLEAPNQQGIGFLFKNNLELLLHQLGSNSMCFTDLLSKHPSQDSHTCPLLTLCKKTNKMKVVLVIPVLERDFGRKQLCSLCGHRKATGPKQPKDHFDSELPMLILLKEHIYKTSAFSC